MPPYYGVLGDGSRGFVIVADDGTPNHLTMKDGWLVANKTRCRANGRTVDMTDAEIGAVTYVDDWLIQRIEGGLRARTRGGNR